MKMYYRNKHAIIWSLFFPLVVMLIFGLFNFEKYNPPKIGIDNRGNSESSKILMESLLDIKAKKILEVDFGSEAQLYEKLEKGELHAFLVIPEDFGLEGPTAEIKTFYDKNRPEEKTAVEAVLSKSLAEVFNETINIPPEYTIESRFKISEQIISTSGQGFKGFLVPGVAAMANGIIFCNIHSYKIQSPRSFKEIKRHSNRSIPFYYWTINNQSCCGSNTNLYSDFRRYLRTGGNHRITQSIRLA